MRFVHSNIPPVKFNVNSFTDEFDFLFSKADKIDIAVGYITTASIAELKRLMELNPGKVLNLIIGMHYIEKFTKAEYNASMNLNNFLLENRCGSISLVKSFMYHGKMYTYSHNGTPFAGLIGSNNLSSILKQSSRVYESSILLDDSNLAKQMLDFCDALRVKASSPIADIDITDFKKNIPVLDGHDKVTKVNEREKIECLTNLTDVSFNLPLKPYEVSGKSNLNVYFGKGRVDSRTGLEKPRPWYEVELIVPKAITSDPLYPKEKTPDAIFDVITDDGWKFKCKISGTGSKNFRSENSLEILGKWIKGRLEDADVLETGKPITQKTLSDYGRDTLRFTKCKKENLWYLDFGVNND